MHLTDKGLIIGIGVIATVGIGVLIGRSIAKKKKAKKEEENKVNFEEQMKKQYEEEMNQKAEEQLKDIKLVNGTDNLLNKAKEIVDENPVYREDISEIMAKDPEFAKLLAKYTTPVEAMAMKHMPSKKDVVNSSNNNIKLQ